ncbi:MAG: hypothetical protein WCB68_07510, partial [Pyrinomonadaceae bacterium]
MALTTPSLASRKKRGASPLDQIVDQSTDKLTRPGGRFTRFIGDPPQVEEPSPVDGASTVRADRAMVRPMDASTTAADSGRFSKFIGDPPQPLALATTATSDVNKPPSGRFSDAIGSAPSAMQEAGPLSPLDTAERELVRLQNAPYKRDSRIHSALKMLAKGLGVEFSGRPARNWNEFYQGVAGAGGAAVAGAIDPTLPDKFQREEDLYKQEREVSDLSKVEDVRSQAAYRAAMANRAEAQAAHAPVQQAEQERTRELGELSRLVRLMGGTYYAGRNPRADELAEKFGVTAPKGTGNKINPGLLKVLHGRHGDQLVYLDPKTRQPQVMYEAGMSEGETQRNAVLLEQLNNSRARLHLPPLKYSEAFESPQSSTETAPPGSESIPVSEGWTPAGPEYVFDGTPAPTKQPALVPSGEPAPTIPTQMRQSGGYGRGGGGSSSSNDKGAQINATVATGLMRDIEEARTIAARAAGKGDLNAKRYY